MPSPTHIFHLLPNAHLDPVWLWDWREGLNEGRITVRTVLDLMDENPELTFMRGESIIYEHIQKTEPGLFKRIRTKIEEGRWDVVGGTVVQPDTNLASTETICREFERGLEYFQKNLGVRPTIAWQADSFGHTAGFPNIMAAFGMTGFAFTRPQRREFPMPDPAFWWEGAGTNRILCYRQHWKWYCSERGGMNEVLDETLRGAESADFVHVGALIGLGNHGGGPTRRHLKDIEAWRLRHPQIEVRFSTLHGFFDALRQEVTSGKGLPVPSVRGEFGYCLRGCYSSVQKFKSLYRVAEARVAEAEITRSLIASATNEPLPDLEDAWASLAFNAFHDILPGSSIERAFDEQIAWNGVALHRAQEVRFAALNRLTDKINTTVPPARGEDLPTDVPLVVWNPLPRPFNGQVELEASLDYRPLWKFQHRGDELPLVVFGHAGKPLPFQRVQTEHTSMQDVPWRLRVVVPLEIPALGWTFVRLGWREKDEAVRFPALCRARRGAGARIANAAWNVAVDGGALRIRHRGTNFFHGNKNLSLRVHEDPWGSWGGMEEEKDSFVLEDLREAWTLRRHEVLEAGPLRARLWTRWQGKNSWLDLTFSVSDAPWLDVEGRLLWNERSARLKLVLPCRGKLTYDVPGATVVREAEGHVPGGRWVTRTAGNRTAGFASNVLSDFDATPDELSVTLTRATRYANDVKMAPEEKMWEPATDCGELKFQFAFFGGNVVPDAVSDALLFPPVAVTTPATKGEWKRKGSLGAVTPASIRLLSLEQIAPGHLRVRVQNRGDKTVPVILQLGNQRIPLDRLEPQEIRTAALEKTEDGRWVKVGAP
jgi:alpha-mannosidase